MWTGMRMKIPATLCAAKLVCNCPSERCDGCVGDKAREMPFVAHKDTSRRTGNAIPIRRLLSPRKRSLQISFIQISRRIAAERRKRYSQRSSRPFEAPPLNSLSAPYLFPFSWKNAFATSQKLISPVDLS